MVEHQERYGKRRQNGGINFFNGVWPPERPSADLSSRRRVGDLRVCEDGALPRMISNAEDVKNIQPPRHRN